MYEKDYQTYLAEHNALAQERGKLLDHLAVVLIGLFLVWTVKMVEWWTEGSFSHWGLLPRDPMGLVGILSMPFLHKDFDHLFANSFGLLVLGLCLFQFYEKVAWRVLVISMLGSGTLVWIFAREAYHIGASAVVYSLSAFIFLSGVLRMRRDRRSVGAGLVVALLFGASIWGILPIEAGISWEGHLGGAVIGSILAFAYRHRGLPPPDTLDEEEYEDDVETDEDYHPSGEYWEDNWYEETSPHRRHGTD